MIGFASYMYYYLKNNVFYLDKKDTGLFLKNNLCSVLIKNKYGYKLFENIRPLLNGEIDVDSKINEIGSEDVKSFFVSLLNILKDNKFVLYSTEIIDLDIYSKEELGFLFNYGSRLSGKTLNILPMNFVLTAPNELIANTVQGVLVDEKNSCKSGTIDDKYVTIRNDKKTVYIYMHDNKLIITENLPDSSRIGSGIADIPLHIFEVLASYVKIRFMGEQTGYDDVLKNDYVYDMKLLMGKTVSVGETNG